jgi:hypothetical protein
MVFYIPLPPFGCKPYSNQLVCYFIFCCVLISTNYIKAIPVANKVTVRVSKKYYSAFQGISCSISRLNNLTDSVSFKDKDRYYTEYRNVRIVKSSQLGSDGGTINALTDYAKDFGGLLYGKNNTRNEVNVTIKLRYDTIIGPTFLQRWNYDSCGSPTDDNGYTNITLANSSWLAGPYHCIVVNDDNTKILGASEPFSIGPSDPVTIQVNKDVFLPGEKLKASIFSMNHTGYNDWDDGDYLRVYKVPYDLRSNPLLLNTGGNATYVGRLYFEYPIIGAEMNRSSIGQTVYWKTPGLYQIVLFSDYLQLIRGISNVFEVGAISRNRNTTVTVLNTTGIYPGQHVSFTIHSPQRPPYNSLITLAFIPARDNVTRYINGTKSWISPHTDGRWKWNNTASTFDLDFYDSVTWDSGTTNLTVTARYTSLLSGWFKVVVQAGGVVIGVSKQFLVKYPYIQMPLPKRIFSQWESIPIKNHINNPYMEDIMDDSNYQYWYQIVPKSYTQPQYVWEDRGPQQFGYTLDDITIVDFTPGLYNVRCFVYDTRWFDNDKYYRLANIILIRNTTFRVVQNDAYLAIADKMKTFKYNDTISFSLTTANKVPIYGGFTMHSTCKYGMLATSLQSNTRTDLSIINGTVQIDWYRFQCYNKQSKVQLYASIGNLSAYSVALTINN